MLKIIIKSYGRYIINNPLRNKKERIKNLKIYLDYVYKNKDKKYKKNLT